MDQSCPDCQTETVNNRFTLIGLLYGIFCFPCGIWCCLRRRQRFCSRCHCEVITTQPTSLSSMGYKFRSYETVHDGVQIDKSKGYRNAALSVQTANASECSNADMYDSQSQLCN